MYFFIIIFFYFVNRHWEENVRVDFPPPYYFCELIGGLKDDVENYRNYCLTLTLYNHTEIYFTDKISIFKTEKRRTIFVRKTP